MRWRSLLSLAALALAPAAAFAEPSFVPVYATNFPDPFVLVTKSGFIAYATNDGINLPMAASSDLVHWTAVMDDTHPGKRLDGMPELGSWAKKDSTWAPEVSAKPPSPDSAPRISSGITWMASAFEAASTGRK